MHLPSLVNLIPFPPRFFMETLTSSCRPSRTSSTHLLPLALYHVIWRQPSSNLCWKSHHLTKIIWKTTVPFLPFHYFLSKILDIVVLHKLLSHLQENNLSNPFQSAYRAGYSTETVLLRIVNDILSLWTITTFLFFFCWIFLPLLALLTTKFSSPAWTLFLAFSLLHSNGFSHTYQSTSVNNSSSSPSQLVYGVPQGSVLGLILFVLYTTPLSDIVNHSVNHQLFVFLKPSTVSLPDSTQHPLLWFCQEPWIYSWFKTVHEEPRHKNLPNCLHQA